MKRASIVTLTTATLLCADASAVEPTFEAGVGLPELVHLRVGVLAHPRLSVHLYGGNVVFNWLAGVSATGYLMGTARPAGPPPHALALRTTLAFNPTLSPVTVRGGGETIGAGALVEVGYNYSAGSGLLLNAMVGTLLYLESSPAAGPLFSIGGGWTF